MTVKTEQRRKPPRIVLYGEPGVGKTTFGCSAPDVALVATEDGSEGIDVFRLPNEGKCQNWNEILYSLGMLLNEDHAYKTVVIDTLNEAAILCAQMVCLREFGGRWHSKAGKEGYNAWAKGSKATAQEMRTLLDSLDKLRLRKNMQVILLAHEGTQRTANALGMDFEKFAPDIDRHVWPVIRAWADLVGHATRDVRVGKDAAGKYKARAVGQERYIYWQGDPGRDAKARAGFELPSRTLLSYEDMARVLRSDWGAELAKQAMELLGQVPEPIRKACGDWLEKAIGSGEISELNLRKLGRSKLPELVNRLLANVPEEEPETESEE